MLHELFNYMAAQFCQVNWIFTSLNHCVSMVINFVFGQFIVRRLCTTYTVLIVYSMQRTLGPNSGTHRKSFYGIIIDPIGPSLIATYPTPAHAMQTHYLDQQHHGHFTTLGTTYIGAMHVQCNVLYYIHLEDRARHHC